MTVEGVTIPAAGETLTVALLVSIAVHWLFNIDRRLVDIIKIEFAAELKTKRLCDYELLVGYDSKVDQIYVVTSGQATF